MKRYEQGSVGMRPDPEGSWCEHEEAQAEIERLRYIVSQVADNIAGAPATIVEHSAEVGKALRRLDKQDAEIERLHEREMNAKCCHCGGVIFAVEDEWAKAKAEIERLNSELLAERLANIGKVHPCNDSTAANLASALADNERLREENKTFRAAQKACEHCDAPTVAEIERLLGLLDEACRWHEQFPIQRKSEALGE